LKIGESRVAIENWVKLDVPGGYKNKCLEEGKANLLLGVNVRALHK